MDPMVYVLFFLSLSMYVLGAKVLIEDEAIEVSFVAAGQGLTDEYTNRRISDLEKEVAESNKKYQELESKLAKFENINSEMIAELKLQQREESAKKNLVIDSLEKQLSEIQAKFDRISSQYPNSNHLKATEENKVKRGPALKNEARRFVLEQGEAVAFHAVVDANGEVRHHGVNQNLVFETVLLNLNYGYHSQNGIFTAPVNGIYMFSTSVLDAGSKPLIHADLVRNGSVLARAYGHGNSGFPEQGSVTVVTMLNAGDKVWVRISCCADGSITGLRYTSFTGALLMST